MKFKDSGLPQNTLLEDAFNHAYGHVMADEKGRVKDVVSRIMMMFEDEMYMLQEDLDAGKVQKGEFDEYKKQIEQARDARLKNKEIIAKKELEKEFITGVLSPAKLLISIDAKVTPDLLAVIMLMPCVKSPIDYQKICAAFGDAIGNVLAEALHIDCYPSERVQNIANASSNNVKLVFFTMMIHSTEQAVQQISQMKSMNPGQQVALPPGQEIQMFEDANLLWGLNKKLDNKFITLFNKLTKLVNSDYFVEVNAQGKPELIKGNRPPSTPNGPTPPKKPPSNDSLGGGVF